VGDAIEWSEFDDLRVDHEEPELVRSSPEQEARQHHVQADALSGAGCAGNDDVGHRREIRVERSTDDVAPEDHGQRRLLGELVEALVLDELTQVHGLSLVVRELEADTALARDRCDDSHLA
jgi:hypothetical protein